MNEVSSTVFTKGGEMFTADALARKLKGAIVELGGEVKKDDNTALAALAGFDEEAEFSNNMESESLEAFIDDFCEAWGQD
jgi:hypothetical protein